VDIRVGFCERGDMLVAVWSRLSRRHSAEENAVGRMEKAGVSGFELLV
jgi:hypothetical protein